MVITDFISITELSRLTNKSRPTIYKYVNDYYKGNFDEIPYSIIKLFKMVGNSSKAEIVAYCNSTYGVGNMRNVDSELQDLDEMIMSNKDRLDIKKIKKYIAGELSDERDKTV